MDVDVNITGIVIQTDRLILRPWRETDLRDFYAYASEPGVGEMAGWPHHRSINATRSVLQTFIKEKTAFAIVNKLDNIVIGSLGLHNSWANEDNKYRQYRVKEIGFVLSKEHWGKGLVPEAVRAVTEFCFIALNIEVLTCGHFMHNTRSKRVIEKCGFTFAMECDYYAKQLRKHFNTARYVLMRNLENACNNETMVVE